MRWLKSLFARPHVRCIALQPLTLPQQTRSQRIVQATRSPDLNICVKRAATGGTHERPWDYSSHSMGQARIAAEAVLFLHVLWCVWVLLGWTVTRGRRVLRMLHIASLAYAIVIQLVSFRHARSQWPKPNSKPEQASNPGMDRSSCTCSMRLSTPTSRSGS